MTRRRRSNLHVNQAICWCHVYTRPDAPKLRSLSCGCPSSDLDTSFIRLWRPGKRNDSDLGYGVCPCRPRTPNVGRRRLGGGPSPDRSGAVTKSPRPSIITGCLGSKPRGVKAWPWQWPLAGREANKIARQDPNAGPYTHPSCHT